MTTIYQLAIAQPTPEAEVWLNAADLGIENITRTRMTGAADSVTFTFTAAAALTADPLFSYGQILRLRRLDTDGQTSTPTLLFLGRVQPTARTATGLREDQSITLLGPWDWFERTIMRQDWTDQNQVTQSAPRATLYWANGKRLTTGQQIKHCVTLAIAGGCPCATPTTDDITTGFTPPIDEQINISIAQAILKCLSNHPHSICWFDYSTRAPRFRVDSRLNLPTTILDISQDKELISITSREDLQPPAVAICYQKPMSDDTEQWMATIVDYAPSITGETDAARATRLSQAGVIWAAFDLSGMVSQYQTLEQTLEVEPIAWDENKTSPTWWARFCPHLNAPNITSITITNPQGTGSLPNFLLSGAVQQWMQVDIAEDTFTADATLIIGNPILPDEIRHEKLIFKKQTTDGRNKTYRQKNLTSYDSGDSIPQGLAAQMWAEWQQLHHDGTITIIQPQSMLTIGPGHTLCLSGGRPEWSTMRAMVKRVTEHFAEGSTEIEFGVPQWIDIDSRFAFYRNCRNRRYSLSRDIAEPQEQPATEETDSATAGIIGLPGDRAGTTPSITSYQHFRTPGASPSHSVLIDTAGGLFGFDFATSAHGNTERMVRVLEVLLPTESGGKVTGAKRAQVLACVPYGSEIPLDTPSPSEGGEWGEVTLPDPPDPIELEHTQWLNGEPVLDINSMQQQNAPVRLSAVLPLDATTHYPCKFIAARFPDAGSEGTSLGIVRGLTNDGEHPLKARLAGVNTIPTGGAQKVYGFFTPSFGSDTSPRWGLWDLEDLFKADLGNKRLYMDLSGYTGFKSLSANTDTWDFNADANLDGKNGATLSIVTDVAWDSTYNMLVVKKRTVTIFKFGLKSISAASPTTVIQGQDCE